VSRGSTGPAVQGAKHGHVAHGLATCLVTFQLAAARQTVCFQAGWATVCATTLATQPILATKHTRLNWTLQIATRCAWAAVACRLQQVCARLLSTSQLTSNTSARQLPR
jgi:hypothetical protein